MTSGVDRLRPGQRQLLAEWFPGAEVVRDHSWGLVGTTVLELLHDDQRYVAKAGDERDHHLARELRAHRSWVVPWTSLGRAPDLVRADGDAKLLVTRHLPGDLAQGSDHEYRPETHQQAGWLLALLHRQSAVRDDAFEARETAKALAWLDRPHRIAPDLEARLRAEVTSWPTPTVLLVPTHGDWQPRNWLVHEGVVSVIDFGRADLRPALTDFARLAAQQFRTDPSLEAAFLEGYGADPREPGAWRRSRVREAIGTAVWAHQVGDEAFERLGHRMIAEVLEEEPSGVQALHVEDLEVASDPGIEAQRRAAGIWARATASRDGLGEAGTVADKLPGIQSSLRREGASLHLASQRGRAVGFALVVPRGRSLEVLYLGVDPAAWGRGIGTHLLRHLDDHAKSVGHRQLELWVIADNTRAIALYERSGWAATHEVTIRNSAGRPERRFVRQVAESLEEGAHCGYLT